MTRRTAAQADTSDALGFALALLAIAALWLVAVVVPPQVMNVLLLYGQGLAVLLLVVGALVLFVSGGRAPRSGGRSS